MPALDFNVGADSRAFPVAVGLPGVVLSESVDVAKTLVVDDRHDVPLHADVGVPVVPGQVGDLASEKVDGLSRGRSSRSSAWLTGSALIHFRYLRSEV